MKLIDSLFDNHTGEQEKISRLKGWQESILEGRRNEVAKRSLKKTTDRSVVESAIPVADHFYDRLKLILDRTIGNFAASAGNSVEQIGRDFGSDVFGIKTRYSSAQKVRVSDTSPPVFGVLSAYAFARLPDELEMMSNQRGQLSWDNLLVRDEAACCIIFDVLWHVLRGNVSKISNQPQGSLGYKHMRIVLGRDGSIWRSLDQKTSNVVDLGQLENELLSFIMDDAIWKRVGALSSIDLG